MARVANDYLTGDFGKNVERFGAFTALSMHNARDAIAELERAVRDLDMSGGMINNFQSKGAKGEEKIYFDTREYDPFWETMQELDVPIYFHPRYAVPHDLKAGTKYGDRRHLLGAGIQFHLNLNWHLYAICSSGIFDRFPKVQTVAGYLGEKQSRHNYTTVTGSFVPYPSTSGEQATGSTTHSSVTRAL
ncbi:amidohydrolase-like protein 2 [Stemphylium lycopersici]|uniref:Amidohydrolase-like protein 2 n=1 Tax=Stemphylium lycopersici TaxID=183478 RepID=A0A364MVG8_STELY|nr:amidohydrolase 2 [Stemphylium lycopersici]RAR02316.1 amidohydrolase-like protein 2 [Stemphylium lycopersici]RAR04880.1 amidohydrolase-like protein 2 [Stemphylium lycopersici]